MCADHRRHPPTRRRLLWERRRVAFSHRRTARIDQRQLAARDLFGPLSRTRAGKKSHQEVDLTNPAPGRPHTISGSLPPPGIADYRVVSVGPQCDSRCPLSQCVILAVAAAFRAQLRRRFPPWPSARRQAWAMVRMASAWTSAVALQPAAEFLGLELPAHRAAARPSP